MPEQTEMVLLQMPRYTRDQHSLVDKTNQKKRWETFGMNGKKKPEHRPWHILEQQQGNQLEKSAVNTAQRGKTCVV